MTQTEATNASPQTAPNIQARDPRQPQKTPRIGIIGNGHVGAALSEGCTQAGLPVQTAGHDAEAVERVARDSDVLVFAVPWKEYEPAVQQAARHLDGKIVVDIANTVDGGNQWSGDPDRSGAQQTQEWAPKARVVKCFNTIPADLMGNGHLAGQPVTAFAAGDDESAKHVVLEVARRIGFEPADAGPLVNARHLESLGYLNMVLGTQGNPSAVRLLRAKARDPPAADAA